MLADLEGRVDQVLVDRAIEIVTRERLEGIVLHLSRAVQAPSLCGASSLH
jgi:hypothetical protein